MAGFSFVPLSRTLPYWPTELFGEPGGILDEIGVCDFTILSDDTQLKVSGTVAWLQEIELKVPAVDALSIVFLSTNGFTQVPFAIQLEPQFQLSLTNLTATLRLRSGFLRPMHQVGGEWVALLDSQGSPMPADITLSGIEVDLNADGDIGVIFPSGAPTLSLPPLGIGDTGIVLEMSGILLFLSRSQTPDGFKGITASSAIIHLSGGLAVSNAPNPVTFTDLKIGSSGFSGEIDAHWSAAFDQSTKTLTGTGVGEFFGVPFGIQSLSLEIQQNVPTGASIKGLLVLPFFDGAVEVDIGFGPNGELSVGIDSTNGLKTVHIDGVMDIELDSIGFDVKDGEMTAKLSGKLTPTFGDFNWPSFDVKELAIDSKGHVKLSGGWMDLPKQYSLDFHGFKVEITKFGMGRNDDGTKWIGMSGGVELVKGLPAGASVKGLRITTNENWGDAKISFEGVGLEFAVPGVFQFKGEVDYKQYMEGVDEIHRFDGDITLKLEAIDLEIDGTLVCGSTPSYNYFALYVDVELPEGIPLGSLPIAFYGFAGLLALQMGPDKLAADKWYDVDGNGWYQRTPPGVEKLEKWKNIKGNRAFGAGVTLGTYEDGGYIFNGRVLLALILPGPIVALTGAFDLFKERSESGPDPMFRTIAILDKPAGTLTFGVDAQYQYDEASGDLIKIHGGMEAFYDFNNPSAWHIYLGIDEPRESRIQARVLSMFDANAYFMVNAHQLSMGAWIGYSKSWHFSKLSVALEAWMENRAIVSFKPAHLHGEMRMHGSVELRVLRFGLGLSVDADIEADVFTPFHVLGDFKVGIRLPRPLKPLSADVKMEWGPRKVPPPRPIAFKQAAIEHFKSSVTWPLSPDNGWLAPVHEDVASNPGFLRDGAGDPDDAAVPANLQDVPMDCRPSVTFARNMWDRALIGAPVQPPDPQWEQIGDPGKNQGQAQAQYNLTSLHLDKFEDGTWQNVAAAEGDPAVDANLFGTWAATTSYGGSGPAHNKLLLWSLSGFDHFRNTSADWGTPFAVAFPSYPCFPAPAPSRVCLKFDSLAERFYMPPLVHPDNSGVTFKVGGPANSPNGLPPNLIGIPDKVWLAALASMSESDLQAYLVAVGLGAPPIPYCGFYVSSAAHVGAESSVLCTEPQSLMTITFASAVSDLTIVVANLIQRPILAYALTADGKTHGPIQQQGNTVTIGLADVVFVTLCTSDGVCLVELCGTFAASKDMSDIYANMAAHNRNAASLWSGLGNVLEPFTPYRLRIATSVAIDGYAYDGSYNTTYPQNQNAYFRTSGPPGIGTVSLPSGADAKNFATGLDDLVRYVEQTIPPTVPAEGQPPLSPRPVYRGYDVGAKFNENYVSLMYKMAGRDLALMLYDRNNLPLRDIAGRIAITQNAWSREPSPTLSASDAQWAAMINASDCATVPISSMQTNEILTAAAEDVLLAPDALYDARLVPSLLLEAFGKFSLGDSALGPYGHLKRWQITDDAGTVNGPSRWAVEAAANPQAHRVAQTSAIGPASTSDPVPRGTMLALGDFPGLGSNDPSQPPMWTDFRLSLYLRSSSGATIGAAFRRNAADDTYLFTMNSIASLRQLVRIWPGGATVLAQDSTAYALTTDYHLVVEALGTSLRVYIDDVLIFDVIDGGIAGGGIALFSSGGGGAAFSEIQAHDLSVKARPVYAFHFTTSPFVNYFHHLHSFEDGCWTLTSNMTDANHLAAAARAVTGPGIAPSDDEARAFEAVAAGAMGQASLQPPAKVEISKIVRNGVAAALLVRSPQPLGFARIDFALQMAAPDMPTAISPMIAKLTGATLHAPSPEQEAITLLLLESADLSGCRIEKRIVPPATAVPLDDASSQWQPVFTFPAMERVPDGYRVTIYSGAPDPNAPAVLRNVNLFRAASGDPGVRVLDDDAVDLRLVGRNGDSMHARRFLEDAAYLAVSGCTLLRKADETAFVVLPPAAANFAPASYRIALSYRLDNSAVDAASPILSQAGSSAAEAVVLAFAWNAFGA